MRQLAPAHGYSLCLHLQDLGNTLRARGRLAEAEALFDEALAWLDGQLGPQHPRAAGVRFDLAMLRLRQGRLEDARALLEHAIASYSQALGADHRRAGKAHLELAEILRQQGHLRDALRHARRGLEIYRKSVAAKHLELASAHTRLGAIAYRAGQQAEALEAFREALAIELAHKAEDALDVGLARANIAEAHLALSRPADALAEIERARVIVSPHLAMIPGLEAMIASVRGRALLAGGEVARARPVLEAAVEGFEALPGDLMAMEPGRCVVGPGLAPWMARAAPRASGPARWPAGRSMYSRPRAPRSTRRDRPSPAGWVCRLSARSPEPAPTASSAQLKEKTHRACNGRAPGRG